MCGFITTKIVPICSWSNLYQNNFTCFLDIFILDKSEPKFTQIYHEKIDIILSWYFHTVRVYQCGFLKSKLMKVVVLSRKNCENYSSENYISQFCLDKAAVLNHVLQLYLEEFELENCKKSKQIDRENIVSYPIVFFFSVVGSKSRL